MPGKIWIVPREAQPSLAEAALAARGTGVNAACLLLGCVCGDCMPWDTVFRARAWRGDSDDKQNRLVHSYVT